MQFWDLSQHWTDRGLLPQYLPIQTEKGHQQLLHFFSSYSPDGKNTLFPHLCKYHVEREMSIQSWFKKIISWRKTLYPCKGSVRAL